MKLAMGLYFALLFLFSSACHSAETDHYLVVTEYVKQLRATEELRVVAEKELKQGGDLNATIIRNGTRTKLQLKTNIGMLNTMHLNGQFETLISTVTDLYQQKLSLYDEMTKIAADFVAGPKPGVDYGAHIARMPELSAALEFIDKTLFNTTPLFFALLIDSKPDKNNHMSHLVITKVQRQQLVDQIVRGFGNKLDQNEQNYTVSSASVLRDYLVKKGYKCSDEF